MAIWNILRPYDIFYGHLVIKWQLGNFHRFGKLCKEKSGNPDKNHQSLLPKKRENALCLSLPFTLIYA
jgi:hypothetical protein